jgi:hypothetical protein
MGSLFYFSSFLPPVTTVKTPIFCEVNHIIISEKMRTLYYSLLRIVQNERNRHPELVSGSEHCQKQMLNRVQHDTLQ